MNTLGSMVDDKTFEKLQSWKDGVEKSPEGHVSKKETEKKPENKVEKKAKGAAAEISRQLNLARNIEENLSKDLQPNPSFNKEYKDIDNKRIIVFKRAQKAIEAIVPTEGDIKENDRILEGQIKKPLSSFIYKQLGEKNKTLLLDYLSEEDFIPNRGEVMKMLGVGEADFYAVYLSDNGCFLQIINPQEVGDPFTDEKARFNIIAPDGSVVAENMDFQEGFNQFEDLSQVYKKDFNLNFEGDSLMEEMQDQEKSEINDINRYNRSKKKLSVEGPDLKHVSRPLEPVENENPFDALLEERGQKTEVEKEDVWESLYEKTQDNANESSEHPFDTLFQKEADKSKEAEDDVRESIYEKPKMPADDNDALLETLYQETSIDNQTDLNREFEKNENQALVNIEPETVSNSMERNSEVLKYAESMGIKPEQLAAHPEFLDLSEAQQRFVLEALNRSSLAKIKVDAYNKFQAERQSKKWYQLGFVFRSNFHKKKHEVLAAREMHEKGLEAYGEDEFSWLTEVIKNGPEIKIDEDGDVESIDYLKAEAGDDEARQSLIEDYNFNAYWLSQSVAGSPEYEENKASLDAAREELLESITDDQDGILLVNKLIAAEDQIKLYQFLKSDPNNEKIIEKLNDTSLGFWQQFKFAMRGVGNKAKYMGIGMTSRAAIGLSGIATGISYAVGPAVAAALGGWLANKRAKANLREQADLSKLGISIDNKAVKSLNLAVGKKEKINIGLADKLESLIHRYETIDDRISWQEVQIDKNRDEKESLSVLPERTKEEEERLAELVKEELQLEMLRREKIDLPQRLEERVKYTTQKMENGLVSFGNQQEASLNYYHLATALKEAKSLLFREEGIIDFQYDNVSVDKDITKWTRAKDIPANDKEFKDTLEEIKKLKIKIGKEDDFDIRIDLQEKLDAMESQRQLIIEKRSSEDKFKKLLSELGKLSVEDRLASFLDFKEDKRQSAEFKYIAGQTATGAVMGATFAAVGAWIFERTGLGEWTSEKLHGLLHATHADQAIAAASTGLKNVSHATHLDQVVDTVRNVISGHTEPAAAVEDLVPSESVPADIQPETSVDVNDNQAPSSKIEAPVSTPEAAPTQAMDTSNNTNVETYERTISNESSENSSVWRSLRDIFKSNAHSLGYEGDMDNSESLNAWAENQTANAIHNSGEVPDKVFEGNKISLVTEDGQFKVQVEAGNGYEPGHLNQDILAGETDNNFHPGSDVNQEDLIELEKVTPVPEAPVAANVPEVDHNAVYEKISHLIPVKAENITVQGNNYIYSEAGKGTINFLANGSGDISISSMADANGKNIPVYFLEEMKGKLPLDKFFSKGGLEKTFSGWNKLAAEDKSVYETLSLFKQNKLTPFDLINKISGLFHVNATQVSVDLDNNHFLLNGKRDFKMDFEGVQKLVKVLNRRFS